MRLAAPLLSLAIVLGGCGALGLGASPCPGWGGAAIAYNGHTTLMDTIFGTRGAEMRPDAYLDQPGELWVSADPIPIVRPPGTMGGIDLPGRQWCFRPDGSNEYLSGGLPDGWSPPVD